MRIKYNGSFLMLETLVDGLWVLMSILDNGMPSGNSLDRFVVQKGMKVMDLAGNYLQD